MELTVQNIFGLLLRSRLMPDADAKAMFQTWREEAGPEAQNSARFAKWLVARNFLTEYQVNLLAQGYAEGFYLGQYKVLDRLGKGRMAGVYHAVHDSGQVVAIKVLPPSKARDPQLLARFHREARLAMKLNHPNVVRAFQIGEADNLHCFVMEYLEGEPLDEVLQRRGRFPPAEAARILYQALMGLQHIHEQWLVHRDLKPSNLMLVPAPIQGDTSKCTVKILDIGLGRNIFDDGHAGKEEDARLTTTGAILGTPDYMSPEQARDARAVDIRSDIYSLGCVLYHLIAGQTVFPDTNIISQMIRHATEEPKPLKDFNSSVPDGLQQIMNWMIAKDPAKRYPTPERAAQALQVYLAAGAEVIVRPEPTPQLRNYLTWLEKGEKKGAAARNVESAPLVPGQERGTPPPQAGAGAPSPSQATAPPSPGTRSTAKHPVFPAGAKPAVTGDRAAARAAARKNFDSKKNRGRKKTGKTRTQIQTTSPAGASSGSPTPNPYPNADVVLVPVAALPQQPSVSPLRVSWRDFIMFGLGVIGSVVAIGAAFLLAKFVS
jgi:eukaryotic-like serine/threonine-protein kinase